MNPVVYLAATTFLLVQKTFKSKLQGIIVMTKIKKVSPMYLQIGTHQARSPLGTGNPCGSLLVWQQATHTRSV